jgi:diaminopropionate ammonia-lyase
MDNILAADMAANSFSLVVNRAGRIDAPWTAAQDAILNETAFAEARRVISAWPGYAPTPLVALPGLAAETGVEAIHYKDESGRFGLGSFKALGGAYAVARVILQRAEAAGTPLDIDDLLKGRRRDAVRRLTVCCATDGNHGRSVAWGAQTFGCGCVIFIHATVSEARKWAIEAFGAQVRRTAGNYDDSVREAQATAQAEGWVVVSDTSYPGYTEIPRHVMQGYEVMAAEAFEELKEPPTHVFLQTGVGGMAAAVAAQAKRRWDDARPLIVLADPDRSACWLESFRAGRPTPVEGQLDTVMAGLACGAVSLLAWEILKDHGDAVVAISDASAVAMMRRLARPQSGDPPLVAGESAVAGLAALVLAIEDRAARKALALTSRSRVLVFGTEGDTDPELYRELVGMDAETVRRGAA